ncbi:hypothetical protein AKJ38_03095 [candidate division MSBL1 archaeon SCGC-AAA259I14]|uniref:Nucleoside phosphorylase domain-containing protein n=1 Tax=candidate division MSBL1 archaeon SCGC-AAA259I14 TaxID=1698268 RepID=A0A133UQQ5_9EURY|nr:hypothetical protein AKJ38_03095 [candidate division MSBL1 archaeon SCGC-AAA259I14]
MDSITFKTGTGKKYHLEIDSMNPNILSAGSPGRVRKIADYLDNTKIIEGGRKMTVVHGEYGDLPVSAFPTGMGPASASVVIPEVIESVEGPITMIRLGTAGGLQPYINTGDIVIGTGAIRDESTTSAIIDAEFPSISDPELVPIIIGNAEMRGYEYEENLWTGIIHVKDDLYFKETPQFSPSREFREPKLKAYKRMGAVSSSMEFSVFTILRDFYKGRRKNNISVGVLLAVISEVREEEHVKVDEEKKEKLEEDLIEIGLDVLKTSDHLRKGEKTEIEFEKIISKMIRSSTRSELLK